MYEKYFFDKHNKSFHKRLFRRKEYIFSYCILGHGPFLVHCPYSEPVLVTVRQVQYLFLGEKNMFTLYVIYSYLTVWHHVLENIIRNAFKFVYLLITWSNKFFYFVHRLWLSPNPAFTLSKIIASLSLVLIHCHIIYLLWHLFMSYGPIPCIYMLIIWYQDQITSLKRRFVAVRSYQLAFFPKNLEIILFTCFQ